MSVGLKKNCGHSPLYPSKVGPPWLPTLRLRAGTLPQPLGKPRTRGTYPLRDQHSPDGMQSRNRPGVKVEQKNWNQNFWFRKLLVKTYIWWWRVEVWQFGLGWGRGGGACISAGVLACDGPIARGDVCCGVGEGGNNYRVFEVISARCWTRSSQLMMKVVFMSLVG